MKYQRISHLLSLLVLLLVCPAISSSGGKTSDANSSKVNNDLVEFSDFCSNQVRLRKHPEKGLAECARVDPKDYHENDSRILFTLFMIILWGAIIRTAIKAWKVPLPYTVVLMMSGLLMGGISKYFCYQMYSFTSIARTSPEIILYTFLPILIFETSFSMSSHSFMRGVSQILLTALPGMLIATFLTAVVCWEFFPEYKWSFLQSCFYGSIISATDPVAVVAILKELGASEMLSVLIDGESLLNDGVAILLYEIFKEQLEDEGPPQSPAAMAFHIILLFLRIAVGGPIFGYLVAKVCSFCLSRVFNDATVEITITLVATYMTYFMSEGVLGVSGVMAVVALGITLNSEKTCISPEAEGEVHEFWEMLGHLANTVLFFICGIVITETALSNITWHDVGYLILLYFALNLIRFLMLLSLSPLLSRLGFGLTWQNMVVMTWGGLRGAVGICLSLQVFQNSHFCTGMGPKVLFQTAGIVFLTLVVNGTTTAKLLSLLKLTDISVGRLEEMQNAMKQVTEAQQTGMARLRFDRFQADSDWETVEKFTTISNPYEIATAKAFEAKNDSSLLSLKGTQDHITECKQCHALVVNEPTAAEYKTMVEEARLRVVKAIKISYWSQFEQGLLSEEAVQILVGLADIVTDKPLSSGKDQIDELRKYWIISGVLPWLKNFMVEKLKADQQDTLPPRPTQKWRWPMYSMATSDWFEGLLLVIVVLNMIPAIWEFAVGLNTPASCGAPTGEKLWFKIANYVFTSLYFMEFLIKLSGRGFKDYFTHKWNYIDLSVLLISIVDIGLGYIPCSTTSPTSTNIRKVLKIMRLVRIFRCVRLVKPLIPAILNLLNMQINIRLFLAYDIATGFVTAVDDVLKYITQMIENEKVLSKIKFLLDKERLMTVKEMGLMQKDHPGITIAVKTRHASRAVLNQMRSALGDLKADGLIDEKENELLSLVVEERMKKLSLSPAYISPGAPEVLFDNLNWVTGNSDLREFIVRNATLLNFGFGDVILETGDPPNGIYVIVNGLVRVFFDPTAAVTEARRRYGVIPNNELFKDVSFESPMEDFFSAGTVLGESAFLTNRPISARVVCETNIVAYHIPTSALNEALDTFNDEFDSLEARMWRSCGMKRGITLLQCEPIYQNWSEDKIQVHLDRSAVPLGSNFETMTIPEFIAEVLLIEGHVQDLQTNEIFVAPCVLPHSCNHFKMLENEYTVNRVLVVAFDNIDFFDLMEHSSTVHRDLIQCLMKSMQLRRLTPDGDVKSVGRQRRYSVALNFGVREAYKRKANNRKSPDEDLEEIRDSRKKGIAEKESKVKKTKER